MSIADELEHYENGLGDAYDAANTMGAVMPVQKNLDNLDATILTIPQPVVNDGTLTIQKNGTTVQTFTANQASNAIANITVPVNTSDLTNDSGFITSADLPTKTSDLTNDGSDGTSTYVEASDLATVATSGSYTDLTNTPTIPAAQVNSDWNASSGVAEILNKPTLATVATSGSYTDLSNTPTIPTATSDLTNDSGFITSASLPGDMTGATSQDAGAHGLVPAPAAGDEGKFLQGNGTWATVSTGTQYSAGNGINIDANNEISIDATVVAEVSDIPTQTSDLTNDGSDGTSTYVEADELATVATTGSYTDLTGAPTIPTVNDATLTVTQNGTTAGTFTANSSTNTTIALTDTTYSAFTGTDGQTAGTAGLVPAPATTDAGKFLKADGTWDTAGSSAITIYSDWDGFNGSYYGANMTFYDGANTSTANVISGASFYTLVTSGSRVEIRPVTSVNRDYVYAVTSNALINSPDQYVATIEGCGYTLSDGGVVGNLVYINNAYINFFTIYWQGTPTVYNATLTVQHNGTTAGTFTANASTNKTINIETIYADTPSAAANPTGWVNTTELVDGAVTAAKTAFGGNYSTTEVDTGFTWIDGKHIYKKTINFGALPNNTTKTVDHNISNLDRIIKIEQSITNGSSNSHGFLHICSGSANNTGFNLYGTNTAIAVNVSSDRSDCNAFFTLWYTKSS